MLGRLQWCTATMHVQAEPWKPWEYRVLHEGHDPQETARRLGRGVADVQCRVETSFADWYARHRCPGSPEEPGSLLRIARRIYEEDGYWKTITDGELEAHILDVTRACFEHFQ